MLLNLTEDEKALIQEYAKSMEKRSKHWCFTRWMNIVVGLILIIAGIWFYIMSFTFLEDDPYVQRFYDIYRIPNSSIEYEIFYMISPDSVKWYSRYQLVGLLSFVIGIVCIGFALFCWNRHLRDSIIAKILREKLEEDKIQ